MNQLTKVSVILLLAFSPMLYAGQKVSAPGKPNLRKMSSDDLKACFDDAKICGTDNIHIIDKELIRRLPELPTDQLVACFDDWKICGTGEGQAHGRPISDEIARRGDPHDLLVRYWKEPKWTIRGGIEDVAYHFDTPEVTAFMRRIMIQRMKDGEDRYWPINYLAKKCDPDALKELSSGRYRNQGSMQYQTSVELFGKCKYRTAIPYLVGDAVFDFSLNIVDAADHSLHKLHPDSPKDFGTLPELQMYYCARAKREGYRVRCKTK